MEKHRRQIKDQKIPTSVKILPPYYMLIGIIQLFGPIFPFNFINAIIAMTIGYFGLGRMKKFGLYGALIISLFAILELIRTFNVRIYSFSILIIILSTIIELPIILLTIYVFFKHRDLYK